MFARLESSFLLSSNHLVPFPTPFPASACLRPTYCPCFNWLDALEEGKEALALVATFNSDFPSTTHPTLFGSQELTSTHQRRERERDKGRKHKLSLLIPFSAALFLATAGAGDKPCPPPYPSSRSKNRADLTHFNPYLVSPSPFRSIAFTLLSTQKLIFFVPRAPQVASPRPPRRTTTATTTTAPGTTVAAAAADWDAASAAAAAEPEAAAEGEAPPAASRTPSPPSSRP